MNCKKCFTARKAELRKFPLPSVKMIIQFVPQQVWELNPLAANDTFRCHN